MRRRLATVALATIGSLALWAPAASAHARLLSSTPAAGATVGPNVGAIELRFDEVITLVPHALVVTGATGAPLTTRAPRVVAGRELTAPMSGELAPGRYFVAWRILAGDGHLESGSFGFTVALAGVAAAPQPAAVPAAPAQPVWPVAVAAALAAVAVAGAGLVVQRGLAAVRSAGQRTFVPPDPDGERTTSATEHTPLRR